MNIEYLGNKELLSLPKTAFFAPRQIAPGAVMPSYDWATEMVRQGRCVISGFSSPIERDVWDFLIKGAQPIIKVNVRAKYEKIPMQYYPLINSDRLLIIFLSLGSRQSRANAAVRNQYVADIADSIVFPSINYTSSLYPIYIAHISKSILLS